MQKLQEVVMTMRCNIAVVVITHDELELVRAILSLLAQKVKPHMVWLLDNGTTNCKALKAIAQSLRILREANIACTFVESDENLNVGVARARIFHAIRATKIEMVTCLDGDDELGDHVLAAMQATYLEHRGKLDVIVPREIAIRYDSDPTRIEILERTIPDIETACSNATDEKVKAWAELTRTGATFGIRVGALARYNGFSKRINDDEWVWKFTGWAKKRATFVYAEIPAVSSYQYWQHDHLRKKDPHAARRELHNAWRRFNTARSALSGKP